MQKTKIVSFAAAAVLSASVLAACGGNTGGNAGGSANAEKYVGHWNIKSLEAGGETLDIQEILNATGDSDSSTIGLDIEKDGKFTLVVYDDHKNTGTWKESGNDTLILDVSGDEQKVIVKNGLLEMSYDEGDQKLTMFFEKAGGNATETATTETATEETETTEETSEETTGN